MAVTWSVPSNYLNQCWNIVNWTLRNELQWNLNRSSNNFIQENAFESVVCEMAAILSWPQCVNNTSRNIHHPGGRLNIKKPSYQYRDSHVKDKTVSPTVLSITWESPYLGKTVFILRRGPGLWYGYWSDIGKLKRQNGLCGPHWSNVAEMERHLSRFLLREDKNTWMETMGLIYTGMLRWWLLRITLTCVKSVGCAIRTNVLWTYLHGLVQDCGNSIAFYRWIIQRLQCLHQVSSHVNTNVLRLVFDLIIQSLICSNVCLNYVNNKINKAGYGSLCHNMD